MDRPDNRTLIRRRHFVAGLAAAALTPIARAQSGNVQPTPTQTLGPFYPRNAAERPPATGPDLVRVEGDRVLARGTPIYLTGRIVDLTGAPIRDARIEAWQCDANAVYHHPAGGAEAERDPNFQGYGVAQVDSAGSYHFRTILPVAYPGRTPHIHVRVEAPGRRPLATQLYLPDHPGNRRDFLYSRLSAAEQAALTLRLAPVASQHPLARLTTQSATADLIVG